MNRTICKALSLLLAAALLLATAACGGTPASSAPQPQEPSSAAPESTEPESVEPESTEPESTESESTEESEPAAAQTPAEAGVLVVYFSATGTTKDIAEKIAAYTGADLYEIKAAQEYTAADLNWNDRNSRTTLEQNDKAARPEIASAPVSLAGYSTVYVGYPIWWGEEPRILDTFVEANSFDGLTVIPFCTSSSSGLGRSGQNLAENAGSGTWLEGKRFGAGAPSSEIEGWIDSLQ